MELNVGRVYRIDDKIGSTSFADLFRGTNVLTGEKVCIKLEALRTRNPMLLWEAKHYKDLAGGIGVPNVHWYGVEGDCNILVVDASGPTLKDLFASCKQKFNLKLVLMLADQVIRRIEYVHSKCFLHP